MIICCRTLELSVGLMCACMPVVALPFRTAVSSMASYWNTLKDYSKTRLFVRSPDHHGIGNAADFDPYLDRSLWDAEPQRLPSMPRGNGTISGLRTFIRRAFDSLASTPVQNSCPMVERETATFGTLGSIDVDEREYHNQLRNIYTPDNKSPGFLPVSSSGSGIVIQTPKASLQRPR